MCYVWSLQLTVVVAVHNIHLSIVIIEVRAVLCEGRTESDVHSVRS
jgi:hypothetical protein